MSEETPRAEGEPSPAVPEEAPTAESRPVTNDAAVQPPDAPADAHATQAMPAASTTPAAATTARPVDDRPAGVFVPKWVALVAAAVLAALVFGGIGYAIGDSSSDSGSPQSASVLPSTGNGSTSPGNGSSGNGGQLPGGELPGGQLPNGNGNGEPSGNAAFLGVGVEPADNGVAISEVQSGSPAADAGLQKGDVITAIDGTDVKTPLALRAAVLKHSSGDEITVAYTRNGSSNTVKVKLTSRSTAQSS